MDWWYDWPSSTLGDPEILGDRMKANIYLGEAKKLLYEVKKQMKFWKLIQNKATRFFDNGAVITARSVSGMDFIKIDVRGLKPEEEALEPACSITLYNLPEVIPPMMWYSPNAVKTETFTKVGHEWVIKKPNGDVEIEGVDYIKTYYSYWVRDCPGCGSVKFTVAEGKDAWIVTGSSDNRPFWYKSEKDDGKLIYNYKGAMVPHFMGYDWTIPPTPPNPLNHTIHSLWAHATAEIIRFGVDQGGTYFLWKAYTEWSNIGPESVSFSRTGLGYMLWKAWVENGNKVLCESKPTVVKVDCCQKPASDRTVKLWWESIPWNEIGGPTCYNQPFMFYGTMIVCEIPPEVFGLYELMCVSWMGYHGKTLMVLPELNGGCIPYTWEVDNGDFIIVPQMPYGESAELKPAVDCPDANDPIVCHQTVTVTVRDRCGSTDRVIFLPCCDEIPEHRNPLTAITYTSLQMACSASQDLSANGGCGPYAWTLSSIGGGGSLSATTGSTVTYTSPATNHNCENNPTITVTDCCGQSATVNLSISCTSPIDAAYTYCEWRYDTCHEVWSGSPSTCSCQSTSTYARHRRYNCQGVLIYDHTDDYGTFTYGGCPPCECPDQNPFYCLAVNAIADLRTPTMLANGCCPITIFGDPL